MDRVELDWDRSDWGRLRLGLITLDSVRGRLGYFRVVKLGTY